MKTLAELKQMSFIPHLDCALCGATVGWEVSPNSPRPYFNPSCDCGCSEGHYETWRTVFEWYNTVFEKESEEAVQAAWNMEGGAMADDRDYTNFVTLSGNGHDALIKERYTTLELFNSARRDIELYINQPAIREAIENHKSNWMPDSKGGEPNHRKEIR